MSMHPQARSARVDRPSISYPRKVLVRAFARVILKTLLPLFARVKIHNPEGLPRRGPVVLAGNHTGIFEVALLAAYSPRQVEFLGTGDIPMDPRFAWMARAYGLIPINRGNLDREGIRKSVSVLRQGGYLGIFPEGGIWDPANMPPQLGVALISQRAQAPIVPIGFSGTQSALRDLLRLRRPRVVVSVGEIIQPAAIDLPSDELRAALTAKSEEVLRAIRNLTPELEQADARAFEEYTLAAETRISGLPGPIVSPQIPGGEVFAKFVLNPVLVDALRRNVGLRIDPLQSDQEAVSNADFRKALEEILTYLSVNPGFFTYRFGMAKGTLIADALACLEEQLADAQASMEEFRLTARVSITYKDGRQEQRERVFVIVPSR